MLTAQVWLMLEVFGCFARGRYRSRTRYPGRRHLKRYRPRPQHYYELSYERVYSSRHVPVWPDQADDEVIYRYLGRSRPVLAISPGLSYVANSGGALHVVG